VADLLGTMRTQTGSHKEGEAIDEDDIKRVAAAVYGGEVLRSLISSWVMLNWLTIGATDTVGILSPYT